MPLALASMLALVLAPPPPDPCGRDTALRREDARGAYGKGDYLAAARGYEALWACGRQPRDLVNGVQSLHLAGRLAEAIEMWTTANAPLPADLRAKGQTLIDAARSHTVQVRVELLVEGAQTPRRAELSLCRVDAEPGTNCLRRELPLIDRRAVIELPLDAATWEARVRWGDETNTVTKTLHVADAPLRETLEWRTRRPHRRLATAYLGIAGVTAATGLGLSVAGWQYDAVQLATGTSQSSLGHLPLRTAGAALGAASIGLAISGATMALTSPPKLRRFGAVGLAVGAALAGTGAGLIAHASQQLAAVPIQLPDPPISQTTTRCSVSFQCVAGEQIAGGVALGLGSGLLIGGVASLIADRPAKRRYAADVTAGRGFAGVRVRVDF